jgi:TonB-dependent starch-binding outer membrane protein SusC
MQHFLSLKKTKYLITLLLLFAAFAGALAQNVAVKGKVTDENGGGLPGVTVLVKGTTTGTSTDAEGNYALSLPGANATLVVTFIGYTTQEIAVNNRTTVNVPMKPDAKALAEVVVIGYGTAERKDLTGAVTSLSGAELTKVPVASAAEAMTGRMAGVQVTTVDGAPGAEIVIRVRGGGSVTQDNSPLYIVDGFPVNSINDIAPSDIASIDILKDASSAAIYGSRGANGVVIITTKSAKAGKTAVSYNGFVQARTFPRKLDVLSPYEFALAQYEYASLRSASDVTNFTKYFGVYDDLELYKSQRGTDWQEELFGNPALSQQHNLSITGGTDKTKMSFSITNNKDEGLMIGSAYARTFLNFKLNHEIGKKLKIDLASRFTNTNIDGAGTSGGSSVRISDGLTTRPVNGIADAIVIDQGASEDDYEDFLRSLVKPNELALQDYRNWKDQILNMNTGISWNIIKNLTFRSELGVDYNFGEQKRFYGPLTGESRNVGGNLPLGEITDTEGNRFRLANTLNYRFKKDDKHDFNFLLGQEILSGTSQSEFQRAKYFAAHLTPEVLFANMGLGTPDRQTTVVNPGERLSSVFGRAMYEFNNRYRANITLRADGSSKFAPGNRLGIFPAVGLGWTISEEEFLKGIPAISNLGLRVSYGEAGNNRIPLDAWRRTYAISSNRTIGFGDVAQPYYTAASGTLVNPDLKWETTITRNAGLDFGIFNNRLTGTLEVYKNSTKDLLVESDIPSYLGYSKQLRNIGETSNRGVELALNSTFVNKGDFQFSGTFNVGINRSRIDKLDGVDVKAFNSNWAGTDLKAIDDYRLIVGQTVGLMYGFVTDGFYTVDDFETYNPTTRTYTLKQGVPNIGAYMGGITLRPGVLKLKDLDGDGNITPENDRQIIGSALPKHTGGFGFNASYKGVDFSTFFNWVYGNDVYNTGRISHNMYYRTSYGNMLNTMNYNDRFKYIDANGGLVTDLEGLRALNENATMWSPFSMGNASPVVHSYAVEDGSFLRLNNVTLGYTLPKILTGRVGMQQFRVYGTVYNAWLWTKYSGYDPEVSTTRSSAYAALTPGVDYSAYPKSRTFTLGVNMTF